LLTQIGLARSSYFYHHARVNLADKYDVIRRRITAIFEANHRCYGYCRVQASLAKQSVTISEKVVQRLMKEECLVVAKPKRRRFGSYLGEISPAPENLINRDFHAKPPNEKWLTDITEFQIPAGKVSLPPIIDCFDGMNAHQPGANFIRLCPVSEKAIVCPQLLLDRLHGRNERSKQGLQIGTLCIERRQAFGTPARRSGGAHTQAEQLQEATQLIGHGCPCGDELGADTQGRPVYMRGRRFHVDAFVPARARQLGKPFRVMDIAFVHAGRKDALRVPGADTFYRDTTLDQPMIQERR
jgi:hypothetical protein